MALRPAPTLFKFQNKFLQQIMALLNQKKKYHTFDGDFWMYLLIPVIPMVVICFLPSLLTKDGVLNFTSTGGIGDTIGGIMSPFVAMVAALLTFVAFWIQYKANIQQRQDIALERFERNLFEMLAAHEQIVSGLILERKGKNPQKEVGRDVFQMLYEDSPLQINGHLWNSLYDALKTDENVKLHMSEETNIWFLDHYFRHLYRIYKYIDEYDNAIVSSLMKQYYGGIVRSHLSPFELVMIFYNGFTHPKFKDLIERYHVLNSLRIGLLASEADRELYRENTEEVNAQIVTYSSSAFKSQETNA